MTQELMLGAVAYDQKVVPIWEGIREYFRGAPVEMDVVLFLNYEAQVNALLAGKIDIAWNTNLAYVRTFHATHGACRVLAMRDTDVEFFTLLVGRAGALVERRGLPGRTLALGSADSAQAAIMPVHYLAQEGLHRATTSRCCGSTATSASTATRAAASAKRSLRCWTDGPTPPRWGRRRGTSSCGRARCRPGELAPFWTSPPYSHCNFTAMPSLNAEVGGRVGVAPARDGLGRTRSIAGSSSSRGCANGSDRSSTATATCSPRWRSRGSRPDGERAEIDDEPAPATTGGASASPRD